MPVGQVAFLILSLPVDVPRHVLADDFRGNPGDCNMAIVESPVDQGVRADNAIIGNSCAFHHQGPNTHPDMVPDYNRLGGVDPFQGGEVNHGMRVAGPDFNLARKEAPSAYGDVAFFRGENVGTDNPGAFTDRNGHPVPLDDDASAQVAIVADDEFVSLPHNLDEESGNIAFRTDRNGVSRTCYLDGFRSGFPQISRLEFIPICDVVHFVPLAGWAVEHFPAGQVNGARS